MGVLLAGGRGRRLGRPKATAPLAGRPLLEWAWRAMSAVVDELAVVAKPDTALPELARAAVWREPAEPSHPLCGLVHALRCARGRAVLVCAGDLPLMEPSLLAQLAFRATQRRPAAVARADGRVQPLVGLYRPAALAGLEGFSPDDAVTELVLDLGPELVDFADPAPFLNVNTPADLRRAALALGPASSAEPQA